MNREIFVKGMFILQEAYEKELSQGTLDVYFGFLGHLTPEQLEGAARKHISKNPWFPKINELLEAAAARGSLPTPIEVWNGLIAAAERARPGEKPEMDVATERALGAIGGWDKFLLTSYDELKWLFKEFKEVYLAAREEDIGGRPELSQPSVPRLEGPE